MSLNVLRRVLWSDLILSALVCLGLFVAAGPISRSMGIESWVPVVGGVVLIPWLGLVGATIGLRPVRAALLAAMVVGNLGSAMACVVMAIGFPSALTAAGRWELGVFAIGLAILGGLELVGLRALPNASDPAPTR